LTNGPLTMFEFFTQVPLGFPGVALEISHQIMLAMHQTLAPATTYQAEHIAITLTSK
jgi:ATP-dependent Clp protease adapter protein ClpS